MATNEPEDIFKDLDVEMMEKIKEKSMGFRIGKSIQSDSSLIIFLKKRPKLGFAGFVDATTLAPVTSPHNRGVRVFNLVCNPPVSSSSADHLRNFEDQIKYLSHMKFGRAARQLLLTTSLPHLDYDLNLSAISDCLLTDCPTIRRDAASRLERLLVTTDPSRIHAVKNQLLYVAQKTHQIVCADPLTEDPGAHDDDHIRRCGHLHLLAMAALLCRVTHRPTLEECSAFLTWPKLSKKNTGSVVTQEVLKLMHAFYERIDRHLKDQKPRTTAQVRLEKKSFQRASFHEQITTFFLVLNEVAADKKRSDKSKAGLAELMSLYSLVLKEEKRWKYECRAGMNTLIIRSLVIILNTTFAKYLQQVGEEGDYDQPVIAAQLLNMIVCRWVNHELLNNLIPHLSTIAFHENTEVRTILTELLEKCGCPPFHYTLHHLHDSTSVTDFRLDICRAQSGESREALDACSWHVLDGHFGEEPACCFVFVHAGRCEAKTSLSKDCIDYANWVDCKKWQRHKQNLEMLAKLCPHKNLIKLMAFQLSPYLFYATESPKESRLLEHLIYHRASHRWLDVLILCRVMHDILTGLEYLLSRQITSRDITTYSMLVSGQSRRGGVAGEMTDILMTDDFSVKLATLELTHQFRGPDRKIVRFVCKEDPIPLLWTSPEALLRGEYSEVSMVYSLGCVMYELWTHGCQPFTSYQKSTADTIRMMLLMPDSVPLIHWPCIPDEIYDIMKQCTSKEPTARPNIPALKLKFMDIHTKRRQTDESVGFEVNAEKEQTYPSFCDDQVQRKHVPEKGIPPDVQQIVDDYRVNHFDSYRNMRASRWVAYTSHSSVDTASELISSEWVEISYREDCTAVREKLSSKFRREELPLLEKCAADESSELPGVTDWIKTTENEPVLEEESADHIVHERRYKPAWSLQEAACKGVLAVSENESGYVSMGVERQLRVLLSLARAVHGLHEAGWLHRDIRASSVLVDCESGQAILARVGRMCRKISPASSAMDEPYDDTRRWLAPEVLTEGKFGKENDVFMLGTAFWEVFWIREVTEKNPTATEIHYAPYANHEKADITALVCEGKHLPKPAMCPEWLYQLLVKCRDPDPAMRPTAEEMVSILDEQLANTRNQERPFLSHPKHLTEKLDSAYDTVPELPSRLQQKRFHPSVRPTSRPLPSVPEAPPTSLNSIRLTDTTTNTPEGRGATSDGGYLTPTSDDVQAVLRSRQSSATSSSSPQSSATGEVFFSDGGSDNLPPPPARHSSRRLPAGSEPHIGLVSGNERGWPGGAGIGSSMVPRNIPGLDSSSFSPDGPSGQLHPSLSTPFPFQPLPVRLVNEEGVYSEIKEQPH